jgi:hypothetical protein
MNTPKQKIAPLQDVIDNVKGRIKKAYKTVKDTVVQSVTRTQLLEPTTKHSQKYIVKCIDADGDDDVIIGEFIGNGKEFENKASFKNLIDRTECGSNIQFFFTHRTGTRREKEAGIEKVYQFRARVMVDIYRKGPNDSFGIPTLGDKLTHLLYLDKNLSYLVVSKSGSSIQENVIGEFEGSQMAFTGINYKCKLSTGGLSCSGCYFYLNTPVHIYEAYSGGKKKRRTRLRRKSKRRGFVSRKTRKHV